MDKKSKKFLFDYLNNASPTGFEQSGQQIWLDYIKPYINDYTVDVYGTAVGIINPKGAYKVVIEAHADEISWFVNYITDDGYIKFLPLGGWWGHVALGQRHAILERERNGGGEGVHQARNRRAFLGHGDEDLTRHPRIGIQADVQVAFVAGDR